MQRLFLGCFTVPANELQSCKSHGYVAKRTSSLCKEVSSAMESSERSHLGAAKSSLNEVGTNFEEAQSSWNKPCDASTSTSTGHEEIGHDASNSTSVELFKKNESEVEEATHTIAHSQGVISSTGDSGEDKDIILGFGASDMPAMPKFDKAAQVTSHEATTNSKNACRQSIDILADGKLVYKTSYVSMLGPKTRQSLDIHAARRSAVRCGSQSQASVVSRSSTDSQNYVWTHGARHYDSESASDLDRIGHLVRLITKGRPLNEVLEDMKETNARLGRQGIYMKNHMIQSGAVRTG